MDLSYVSVYVECALLAEICEKHGLVTNSKESVVNMTVVSQDGIVKMSTELEGSGVDMPGTGIPNGRSVARWFAQLLKLFDGRAFGFDNSTVLMNTAAEIEKNAEEIDEHLEYAELVFHRNDTNDSAYNSHYEEIHPNNRTAEIIGMSCSMWDYLWTCHNHSEFEKFLDSDDKLGIEAYSPDNYPFWLFLAEGWAEETSKNQFFRKMMEHYGSKTLKSGGTNSVIREFERQKEQLLQRINNRIENPRNIDFFGKVVVGIHHCTAYRAPLLRVSPKTDGLKQYHLYDRQILRYGGLPRKSMSSKTDYFVIARNVDSWSAYLPAEANPTPEELEVERYRNFITYLEKWILADLDKVDEMRAKQRKEPVKFIWEDEFNAWLLETFPPCDEETLRSEDSDWLFQRDGYIKEAEKNARNNIRP